MPVPARRPSAVGRPVAGRPVDGGLADVAYRLGERCEREGDLEKAARWFRRAAEAERPMAALRLGAVLGRLADDRDRADRAASGSLERSGSREVLLAEATRWLSEAPDATTPDAIVLITDMLRRHHRQAARRGLEVPVG